MNTDKINIEGPLDRTWIASLIAEGYSTYDIIKNYEIKEEVILECNDFLDKSILIQGINFSEDFIRKAIDIGYFDLSDIYDLSMTTYSNLSAEFITEYKESINWNRMILYVSTTSDSFDSYIDTIISNDLWRYISANNLPIEFIRQWKDKLDWSYLSMVKFFTEEEKEEFSDYILAPVQKDMTEETEEFYLDKLKIKDKMTDEELEDLINKINLQIGNNYELSSESFRKT